MSYYVKGYSDPKNSTIVKATLSGSSTVEDFAEVTESSVVFPDISPYYDRRVQLVSLSINQQTGKSINTPYVVCTKEITSVYENLDTVFHYWFSDGGTYTYSRSIGWKEGIKDTKQTASTTTSTITMTNPTTIGGVTFYQRVDNSGSTTYNWEWA